MKKVTIFSLLAISVIISGCSINSSNNNKFTPLESSISEIPNEIISESVDTQEDYKTYSNIELGIAFDYPKEWSEPVLKNNRASNGSYFDINNQWEIGLGEARKIGGENKYLLTIRGYYPQDKKEILSQLNDDENKGSLWFIDEFQNNQSVKISYGEAGIAGVENIMIFGAEGKTVRIQSLGGFFDSDINSIASSLRFINTIEDSVKENSVKEETYKGWFVFYNKESDIKNTNLKLDTYYLVKKEDINKDFTFVHFNANKSAIDLLELEIISDCNFVSPKNEYYEEQRGTCADSIKGYPTGLFGDRVTVTGVVEDNILLVNNLTLNSFSSVEQW